MLICIIAISGIAQPRLERHGTATRIVTNDSPMLMIGGELGNSSASTRSDLKRIFPHLKRLGLNTVLAPVSWELIEPHEGEFDMSTLDDILTEARDNDLKVVLLWFGAWKNSMSLLYSGMVQARYKAVSPCAYRLRQAIGRGKRIEQQRHGSRQESILQNNGASARP